MKGCIKIYVISFLLISQIHAAADKTLFDEQDDVIVFKENNYQQGLYDGVKAHTFLIYSSWCGHCQRFAPTYKYAISLFHELTMVSHFKYISELVLLLYTTQNFWNNLSFRFIPLILSDFAQESGRSNQKLV